MAKDKRVLVETLQRVIIGNRLFSMVGSFKFDSIVVVVVHQSHLGGAVWSSDLPEVTIKVN